MMKRRSNQFFVLKIESLQHLVGSEINIFRYLQINDNLTSDKIVIISK